jgi:endoglucanase
MPMTYAGLPVITAGKAVLADETFLADTWTQYLGPLQQGRREFGDWSSDAEMFTVDVAGLTVMKAANQTLALTFKVSGLCSLMVGTLTDEHNSSLQAWI